MNYLLNASEQMQENGYNPVYAEELKEQVSLLIEWKCQAKVQLEYFRSACSLYKLCEVDKVNELLNN